MKIPLLIVAALACLQEAKEETFAILHSPGAKWNKSASFDKQPGIGDHVKYFMALAEKGVVIEGGPFTDGAGGMMVVRAANLDAAKKIAADDPAVKGQTLKADVHPWKIVIRETKKEKEKEKKSLTEPAGLTETAPEEFRAVFDTSAGPFTIKVVRKWAPVGADRFYNLVANGYFDGCRFFRVIPGFMAQFGIHGDPNVAAAWKVANIKDDPVVASNKRGFVSFATAGPNTRTTQLFISYGNNARLDGMGFSPFGEVIEGMATVDKLYGEYGEGEPNGQGPSQGRIQKEGNEYLEKSFPKLDFIKTAKIAP